MGRGHAPKQRATSPHLALLVLWVGACGARTALLPGEPAGTSRGEDGGQPVSDSGGLALDSPASLEASVDAGPPGDVAAPDAPVTATPPPDFAWYRLDETAGTTAHDSSPHRYDITNLDGVVWGGGATFDGATVCGSTTVDGAFRRAPVTMTAWLTADPRDDETSTDHALAPFPPSALSGDAPSAGGFGLGLDVWTDGTPGNGVAFETGVNAAVAFHTIAGVVAGEQVFVALVVGPSQADLYVDASRWASVQADTPSPVTPAPLHLGCHNDDTNYLTKRFFKGRMRDARIYTRLLGTAEIAQLYANGPV